MSQQRSTIFLILHAGYHGYQVRHFLNMVGDTGPFILQKRVREPDYDFCGLVGRA